jgi:hypothetical protein
MNTQLVSDTAIQPSGLTSTMTDIALRYGVEADFDRTMPIIERHGLTF